MEKYLDSNNKKRLHRKTMSVVVLSQTLGGLGLAAGITVGALIAQDLLGTDKYAGLPAALFTLGSALAAMLVANITGKRGRRIGLSMGFLMGGLGAFGVIFSTATRNVYLFFLFLFLYGFGSATNLQARYAGSDLAETNEKSKAISTAMIATTLGAILGPNLSQPMGHVAQSLGLPMLTGSFILSGIANRLAGISFFILLRPDPYLVAQFLHKHTKPEKASTSVERSVDKPRLLMGTVVMVVSQLIMVAIMTMTPIHMKHGQQHMDSVGLVIGVHIGAMYLPSLVTGRLITRFGAIKIALLGALTLAISALVTAMMPSTSLFGLGAGLLLLGLGWNFGLISGTTLVVESSPTGLMTRNQGRTDVLIALGGSIGGAMSGYIVASYSYGILSAIGLVLSLMLGAYIFKEKNQFA